MWFRQKSKPFVVHESAWFCRFIYHSSGLKIVVSLMKLAKKSRCAHNFKDYSSLGWAVHCILWSGINVVFSWFKSLSTVKWCHFTYQTVLHFLIFAFNGLVIILTLLMIIEQKSHCVNICRILEYSFNVSIAIKGYKHHDIWCPALALMECFWWESKGLWFIVCIYLKLVILIVIINIHSRP